MPLILKYIEFEMVEEEEAKKVVVPNIRTKAQRFLNVKRSYHKAMVALVAHMQPTILFNVQKGGGLFYHKRIQMSFL